MEVDELLGHPDIHEAVLGEGTVRSISAENIHLRAGRVGAGPAAGLELLTLLEDEGPCLLPGLSSPGLGDVVKTDHLLGLVQDLIRTVEDDTAVLGSLLRYREESEQKKKKKGQ